ncbi:MAG: response regulator [Nitrospirae bacterium]|nr:MAG: response regulator [Nitrospirota bacterium]
MDGEQDKAKNTEMILLVDDDEIVRKFVLHVLQASGYAVIEASNGPEALRIANEHTGPINLLLTDIKMPKMNGRELAERLMPLRPGVKVLYISGHTDSATVNEMALQRGANFLQKPFTPDRLTTKVRKVLDSPVTP